MSLRSSERGLKYVNVAQMLRYPPSLRSSERGLKFKSQMEFGGAMGRSVRRSVD